MVIDLEGLMQGSQEQLALDCMLDFSNETLNGRVPFTTPVHVTGEIRNKAGIVTLDAVAAFTFTFDCDRCASRTEKKMQVPLVHTLLQELSNDKDWEDYIVVPDLQLNLADLALEDIYLSLPSKLLCKDDCKGLCPQCGTNLNEASCNCKKEVDPRLEALLSMLDD